MCVFIYLLFFDRHLGYNIFNEFSYFLRRYIHMILSNEALASLLTGAIRTESEPHGLRPWRFSQSHMERMQPNEAYCLRAEASSGMTLDFETNSRALEFDIVSKPAAGTPWYGLDITVNGRLAYHKLNKSGDTVSNVKVSLPEETSHVKFYLPNLCSVRLSKFTLDDGSFVRPVPQKSKLLFIGDSITQGYTTEHPSFSLVSRLCDALDAECLNQAIGGATYNADQLDAENGYQPDLIFASYGTNDWSLKQDLTENASRWFERLHKLYGNTPVCVLLPIWRPNIALREADGCEPFLQAREKITAVCSRYPNCHVIDTFDFVPHDTAFFHDHVHPNEAGFEKYASAVLKAVQELRLL